MKCNVTVCYSTFVCNRYLRMKYSDCPVSFPVGASAKREVAPQKSCPMVRKDTNLKMK